MKQYWQRVLFMSVLVLILGAPALLAQKYEVNPYGGYYWPTRTNVGQLDNSSIWGLRGGWFLDPGFELEGNFGYMSRFKVADLDVKSHGLLWEVAGNYNFSAQEWPVVRQFTPFVVLGLGGITTHLKDEDSVTFTTPGFVVNPLTGVIIPIGRTVEVGDGNTFFNVSYGGGFKSVKLWGPLGLRFEARGRTMPNFYHSSPTSLEVTGGINFMWGER